jgi:hypothetical protein
MDFDFKKSARSFLADCAENLKNCIKNGHEPTMDIVLFGVTFEFRLKDYYLNKEMKCKSTVEPS